MCKEKQKQSLLTQNDFPTQQVHANRKKLRQIENIIVDFIPKMVTLDPSHQTVVEFLSSIRSSLTQKRKVDEMFNFLMVGPPPPILHQSPQQHSGVRFIKNISAAPWAFQSATIIAPMHLVNAGYRPAHFSIITFV